jgi:hypothetical protein
MDLLSFVIGISSTLFIIFNLSLFLSWRKNEMSIKNLERTIDAIERRKDEDIRILDNELSRVKENLEDSIKSIEMHFSENLRALDNELSRVRDNTDNLRNNI